MKKQLHIIIHLLPREIDEFDRMIDTLTRGSYSIDKAWNVDLILDVTLNLSEKLTDWDNSIIPESFFNNKFNHTLSKCSWATVISDINYSDVCLGINDKRRNSIRKYNPTHFMYLDPDLHFAPSAIAYAASAINQITDDHYVLSGQLLKLWDSSWDIISSPEFKNIPGKPWLDVDPYSLDKYASLAHVGIKKIEKVKIGGGWWNIITAKALKFIDIPDSLGSYGLDDTFVMYGLQMLSIPQYVLDGVLVMENRKFRYNPYEGYITDLTSDPQHKENMAKESSKSYARELEKLQTKIKTTWE